MKYNVKLLTETKPYVKENYNSLITKYWEVFDGIFTWEDAQYGTSAESISRAFRSLVRSGDIVVSEKTKIIRGQEQSDYRRHYAKESI